jgi:hypothetical protein
MVVATVTSRAEITTANEYDSIDLFQDSLDIVHRR